MAKKTVRQRFPKAIFKEEDVKKAEKIAIRGGALSTKITEEENDWILTIVWDPDA